LIRFMVMKMEEKEKRHKYPAVKTALYLLGVAVLLQVIETVMKQQNMEFRTFMQVIKGIYQWLVVPITLVFALYCDFFREKSKAYFRYLVPTILVIIIVAASLFRGICYLFTMVDEQMMEDGIIRGSISSYSGERYVYYEPVMGIFRKPFEGWSDEKLNGILRQRHGEGVSLVKVVSDEYKVYSAPSSRTGVEPFYFRIWGTYDLSDNFAYSLMKSDALSFWRQGVGSDGHRKQHRFCGFMSDSGLLVRDEASGEWDTSQYPGNEDYLVINCYSKEDAANCAADLADWILYAVSDKRYFCEQEDYSAGDELFWLWIKFYDENGAKTSREYLGEYKDAALENNWQQLYQGIEDVLTDYYSRTEELYAGKDLQDTENGNAQTAEPVQEDEVSRAEVFMERYQGDYEKEIFLEDGKTGYRMVVMDAALGSRCYALLKSTDGGESWQMESGDPFGETGQGIDFIFLDEELGFAALSHNGGDEAYLFVTENGGKSYEQVVMQGITVTLEDGTVYNPYDYPEMPYEEDGKLYVLCGQGMDGDYNGGDAAGMALFESTDRGHTFVYKEIRAGE